MRQHHNHKIVFVLSAVLGLGIGIVAIGSLSSSGKAQSADKKPTVTLEPPDMKSQVGDDQLKIELIGVTDRLCKSNGTPRLVDHLWDAKGDPIYGIEVRMTDCRINYLVSQEVDPKWRYVVVGFTFPNYNAIDVLQHVPLPEKRSPFNWQLHEPEDYFYDSVTAQAEGKRGFYIARVEKDELQKNGFKLSYGSGAWKEESSVTNLPAKTETSTIAQGSWGKLTYSVHANPPEGMYSGGNRTDANSPLIYPHFKVTNAQPTENQVRLGILVKGSKEVSYSLSATLKADQIEKVIVETRTLKHLAFKSIATDPNPKSWADIRWGEEGRKNMANLGEIGAVVGFKYMGGMYTTDGRPWRDYGAHHEDQFSLHSTSSPSEDSADQIYSAVVTIKKAFLSEGAVARVSAFGSKENEPGKDLGSVLSSFFFNRPSPTEIDFSFVKPKDVEYVQFKVETADGSWDTIGKASSIDLKTYEADIKWLDANRKEGMTNEVRFEIIFDPKGHFGWNYKRVGIPGKSSIERSQLVTWKAGDYDYCVLVHLKGGKSLVYKPNLPNEEQFDVLDFGPDRSFVLTGSVGTTTVTLSDVEAFTVQKRKFNDPFYVVTQLPGKKPFDLVSCASITRLWKFKQEQAQKSVGSAMNGIPTTRPKTR